MRRPIATGLFLLAAASTAVASTPESGTVSKDAPSVTWEGKAAGYGVIPLNLLTEAGGTEPTCEAPTCDTFALKVADKLTLDVLARSRSGAGVEVHIKKPDGSVVVARTPDEDSVKMRVKDAAPGDYTVEVLVNDTAEAGEFDATASLVVPAAPPAPGAAPAPTPAPAAAPAPASEAPAATLGLATKSVLAKKKAFRLALTSSKPVTGVKVALRKGKKVVAKGALASLNGTGSITLKVKKKLKPGTYVFAATAMDGSRAVGLTTTLKVKK
jgi:hypothetical protein